jgi:hypothetical protein
MSDDVVEVTGELTQVIPPEEKSRYVGPAVREHTEGEYIATLDTRGRLGVREKVETFLGWLSEPSQLTDGVYHVTFPDSEPTEGERVTVRMEAVPGLDLHRVLAVKPGVSA